MKHKNWFKWIVPETGHYTVRTAEKLYRHTGEFEWVKNSSRKWWQVWKPKMVFEEKILMIEEVGGMHTKFFQVGETINAIGVKPELVENPHGVFTT